jgi:hypothetical protein
VLFLDILGFSDLVKNGRVHRLLGALEHLQGRALEVKEEGQFDFTAFSDCVVVSTPLSDTKAALRLTIYAKFLALDLLAKGFLTRGAIVSGDLYHKGAIVLGPALVDAYQLESKKALYPRILVSNEILRAVYSAMSPANLSESFAFLHPIFREDFDGSQHIDIFENGPHIPEMYGGQPSEDGKIDRDTFRDSLLIFIDRIFATPPPPVAAEKYAWLARYFFEKCQNQRWPLPNNLPVSHFKRLVYERELTSDKAADKQE